MMEVVQKVTFSITDGDMNPGKFLSGIFGFDGFCCMLFNNPIQLAIAAKIVRFNPTVWIKVLLGNVYNGLRGKIRNSFHLEVPARICWPALGSFLRSTRFSHNHNRCFVFASPATLGFAPTLSSVFRVNSGKEALIHFSRTGKNILFIPGAHGHSNLLHHVPNGFVSFVPQLALDFFGGETFLGGSHQMYDHKPHPERKIGILHHGSTSKSCPCPAMFALKLFNRFHPVVFSMFAFSTLHAHLKAVVSKGIPARLFVRELFDKFYELHIQNFESKLTAQNVTYLRWVYD